MLTLWTADMGTCGLIGSWPVEPYTAPSANALPLSFFFWFVQQQAMIKTMSTRPAVPITAIIGVDTSKDADRLVASKATTSAVVVLVLVLVRVVPVLVKVVCVRVVTVVAVWVVVVTVVSGGATHSQSSAVLPPRP